MEKKHFEQIRLALVGIVGEANFLFENNPEWSGRRGGYFCLADSRTGQPLFEPTQIGEVVAEKAEKYIRLSKEKAERLAKHPDHTSSYDSRNPAVDQWGGAIRPSEDLIFSFSGYPELGDEALMLVLAEVHYIGDSRVNALVKDIATKHDNRYWNRLSGFMRRFV